MKFQDFFGFELPLVKMSFTKLLGIMTIQTGFLGLFLQGLVSLPVLRLLGSFSTSQPSAFQSSKVMDVSVNPWLCEML